MQLTEGAATGIALIPVDKKGENSIIVSSGANALLSEADMDAAKEVVCGAKILLMQLETPLATLERAAADAHASGVTVVLNPAPFPKEPLPAALLQNVDVLTPNETEASAMSGVEVTDEASALRAIGKIQEKGVKNVIITAGGAGAYTAKDGALVHVPAFPTKVVDTTAAGDTFCGALCVALSHDSSLDEAIRFANKAASLSVRRMGAWRSIPYLKEVEDNKES